MLGFSSPKRLARTSLPMNKSTTITVLDIGTTKVCCIIAKLHPRTGGSELSGRTHDVQLIGFGHHRSQGIKAGTVVDLNEAEQAIRLAVDKAERQAGMTVESIIVNISGNRMKSSTFSANVSLAGQEVEDLDIQRVLQAGRNHSEADEHTVIYSQPIGYALDGTDGIKDPRGMVGERLGVDMHCITINDASLSNLELAINRCHLAVENFVVTPHASGLACLTSDESELGVACIDMGGGTTTVSVFFNGEFIHYDGIAIGGQHVTMDLARGLSTNLRDAELIKVKHGSVLPAALEGDDPVSISPFVDEGRGLSNVSASALSKIIRPRVEETLELIRDRLNTSGFAPLVGRRMVLTGGACQLTGMSELARRIMGKNVRLGRPLGVRGLPEEARGAPFSAVIGLAIFPQVTRIEENGGMTRPSALSGHQKTGTGSYFGRVGRWFSENF